MLELGCTASVELMLQFLEKQYNEKPAYIARIGNANAPAMITVSPTGTWTMFAARASGSICFISSGTEWKSVPEVEDRGF